jgi:AraC-like DNA-binding protein
VKLFDNFLGTIFLTVSVQGLLLGAILLFIKKGALTPNRILGTLTILFSLDIFYYVFSWSKWNFEFIHLNAFAEPFPLIYGPLIFLYITTLETGKFKLKYLIHFIPFLLALLYYSPFYVLSTDAKREFMINLISKKEGTPLSFISDIIQYGKPFSIACYALLVLKYFLAERVKVNKYATDQEKIKKEWVKKITIFFLVFASAFLAYYLLVFTGLLKPAYDYAIAVVMSACIYLIAYNGFRQPSIFAYNILKNKLKYEKTLLADNFVERTKQRLLSLIETSKPYLKSDLKIQELAEILQVSSHQLSQVINKEFGQVFTDFISTYRVEEAKNKLSDAANENDKILKVALESGFNNKTSFNNTFKKITGMTPTAYRNKHLGNISATIN